MYRRILVPVDFTAKNARALDAARELAELSGGEVTLVHVVETLGEDADDELESFYRKLETQAEERVAELLASLGGGHFDKRSVVLLGHRVHTLVAFANEDRSDVMVLSSHRVDPERPAADWMTISYRLSILAQCPVLLVK
jgi:nucleotide-binding universal stress UspA family protein